MAYLQLPYHSAIVRLPRRNPYSHCAPSRSTPSVAPCCSSAGLSRGRHIAPDLSLCTIGSLSGSLKDLEAQLDNAVATARSAGVSWDKIGRTFGITRQGAQRRWETVSAAA